MKAVDIKWDVVDEAKDMTKEEVDEILKTLPTEVEIPKHLFETSEKIEIETEFDYYYPDISDWLSNEFGFCHYGFEVEF